MPTNPSRRAVLRSVSATLTCAGMLLGTSACSDSATPKAATLVSDAKKAAASAASTSVVINGSDGGVTTTMTVAGALDGSNQQQVQKQGSASSEGIVIGKTAYLKANAEYWQQGGMPAASAQQLQNSWWQGTSDGSANPAVDVAKLLTDFFASSDGKKLTADSAKVSETTTDGTTTYTISDPKTAGSATLAVARDGDHHIVKITNYASSLTSTKATYTFSRWNAVETFKAPAGAKPISSIAGG